MLRYCTCRSRGKYRLNNVPRSNRALVKAVKGRHWSLHNPLTQPSSHSYLRMPVPSFQWPSPATLTSNAPKRKAPSPWQAPSPLDSLKRPLTPHPPPFEAIQGPYPHLPAKCKVLYGRNRSHCLVWGLPDPPFQSGKNTVWGGFSFVFTIDGPFEASQTPLPKSFVGQVQLWPSKDEGMPTK